MFLNIPNTKYRGTSIRGPRQSESGVTILEMVVAMLIMTVGLLGMAAAIGYAVTVSNKGRNVTNNKLLVVSILEQMENLRNTNQLTFGQIANTGSVDNSQATTTFTGFPATFQQVSINPGPDGIYGTADDLIDPGADGIYGTADDFTDQAWGVAGYTRQILITNLSTNLKRIQVTLQYPDTNGQTQQIVGVSYLNNNDVTNFR